MRLNFEAVSGFPNLLLQNNVLNEQVWSTVEHFLRQLARSGNADLPVRTGTFGTDLLNGAPQHIDPPNNNIRVKGSKINRRKSLYGPASKARVLYMRGMVYRA